MNFWAVLCIFLYINLIAVDSLDYINLKIDFIIPLLTNNSIPVWNARVSPVISIGGHVINHHVSVAVLLILWAVGVSVLSCCGWTLLADGFQWIKVAGLSRPPQSSTRSNSSLYSLHQLRPSLISQTERILSAVTLCVDEMSVSVGESFVLSARTQHHFALLKSVYLTLMYQRNSNGSSYT